jgi:hypothetical protein
VISGGVGTTYAGRTYAGGAYVDYSGPAPLNMPATAVVTDFVLTGAEVDDYVLTSAEVTDS